MKQGTPSDTRIKAKGRWRTVLLVINAGLVSIGLWAVFGPNTSDATLQWWSMPAIAAIASLVVVPAFAVTALLRPTNRILNWTAMVVNVIGAGVTAFILVLGGGVRVNDPSLVYPVIGFVITPVLTAAVLWRVMRGQAVRDAMKV